jgi:penicillin-binding protein 1A
LTDQRSKPKPQPKKQSKKQKSVKHAILKWSVMGLMWGLLSVFIISIWLGYDLPDVKRLEAATRRPSITLLARDGTRFATLGDYYSHPIHAQKLSKHITQAFLAIEDRRFYSHWGVDVWGIMRAVARNVMAKGVVQGGSTITQQLAKNFLLSEGLFSYQDRSLRRKLQEVLLAVWLEAKFSKDQILTLYLNRAYFGGGAFGLEAASQRYFGKTAKSLTLYEAAVLAGLLKAPTKLAPTSNPEKTHERAAQVLVSMKEAGFITEAQYKGAQKTDKALQQVKQGSMLGRYYCDWILEQIPGLIGPIMDDLVVTTTLDVPLQHLAERETAKIMTTDAEKLHCSQVGLVAISTSGAVRALVGGKSYGESQFNRATQALRQTGSSFKFFIYLAAIESGLSPETQVVDTPLTIGHWSPKNYKYESRGQISLCEGFAYSVNVVSARIARHIGTGAIHKLVRRFGIKTPLPNDLTIALGSGDATLLEMTAAYGAIPNEGYEVEPFGIVEIKTRQGKILYQHPGRTYRQLIAPEHVDQMRQLMSAVMEYGTGKNAALYQACWGKSGTSQKHRDAWFIGFTSAIVTGVWMGNDDNQPMDQVTGAKLPGKLWKNFMQAAHQEVE